MSYREKSAWLALVAMAVTLIPFFAYVAVNKHHDDPLSDLTPLWAYGISAVARLIILGVGFIVLRSMHQDEARTPLDERDLAIERKATHYAYYMLMFGTIVVGCILPFSNRGWGLVTAAILVIVLAECVRYGLLVFGYRRLA